MQKRLAILWLMLALPLGAGKRAGEWTGNYPPCDRHEELLKQVHMDLGIRFSTSDQELVLEFARAMDFWATILDMDWHKEDSRNCAIQIVDGSSRLFKSVEVARAQFPGRPLFQGWIAVNPKASMAANELFLMSVHELGHVFGLPHSNNASSVMYFLLLDGPTFLDDADLATLATRHKLRMMAVPSILTTQSAQSAHVSGSSYCAIRADDSHGCDSANSTVLSAR